MSQIDLPYIDKPFQVGEWLADPDSGRLTRGEEEVKLEPKVMSVLVCLAQNPGKVVSRETLESTVWAGTIVGYDAIAGSIIKLRKALGDDSRNPRYIETVSKKGYRLIADVSSGIANEVSTVDGHDTEDIEPDESRAPAPYQTRARSVTTQLTAAVIGLIIIVAGWQILNTDPGSTPNRNEEAVEESTKSNPSPTVKAEP